MKIIDDREGPRRLPRAERRALLVRAASDAFGENGYHATSMDDIARRASVSKPVLYRHFDSKLELYVALAEEIAGEIVSTIEEALASAGEPRERIAAAFDAFFAYVDRPGSGYRMVFASDLNHEPTVAQVIEGARSRAAATIGRTVQECTGLGEQECTLLSLALIELAESAALAWDAGHVPVSRERAAGLVTNLVWCGMSGMREGTCPDSVPA